MENRNMRAWHVRWLPSGKQTICCYVDNIEQALFVLAALAKSDLMLDDMCQDLVCANMQGLEVLVDGEWEEYEDEDGRDISDLGDGELDVWTRFETEPVPR